MLGIFFIFCRRLSFSFRTNSLGPDQARGSAGPDLGPNCLQRSEVDNKIVVGKELTSSSNRNELLPADRLRIHQ